MNTHIPQSIETAYELQELTAVPTQIISPASSEPIIQVKEDTLTAAYLFTLPHMHLSKKEVYNLLMTNDKFTGKMPKAQADGKWTGQDMFSMFLPDISFRKHNKNYDIDQADYNTVVVENGKFKQGILDKTIIGKTLIQMIYDSYGNKAVKDFLDNNQRMLTRWLAGNGFTIGMGDCIPKKEDIEKIEEFVASKIVDVNSLIKEAQQGTYNQNLDSKFIKMSLEADIQEQLDGAKFNFEKYIRKNINDDNAIYVTMTAGSKGTISNVSQIRGMVGQTSVAGKRISFGYERRTLPLFSKDDYGARSRGFIANNFFNGLDPIDYFFHQMGGREGVIDTAIKSVSADTPIIIMEDNEAKYVKIGEWIDEMMDKRKADVEHKEQLEQELLNLNVPTYIPTTDDDGNVSWGDVVAVTRHDPGQGMFKVTTASGRDVKVVESKSLIVWDIELEKFKEVNTSDVNIGDLLPVMHQLVEFAGVVIENSEEMRVINNAINGIFTVLSGEDSYKRCNDVVLDPIVSIERLNVEDYPKVYDITVPSTLNFGLANGLMVRDTAESGYMQRRLIKALEDLSVKYGGTIRNGINNIVQFAYGDDGIDPCKLNKQELRLVEYSNEEMEKRYLITDHDMGLLKSIMTPSAYKELVSYGKFEEDYGILMGMREKARKFYFKDMNVMNTTVYSPVYFPRTIKNARDMFHYVKRTDLTPQYIRQCFDELEKELLKYLPDYSINIFKALLYSNLSPKVCLMEYKFNKTVFKYVIDTIREKYLSSLVQPGEMVGVIGAQSMGEPLTQMSVPSDTQVIVQYNGIMRKIEIGELVDGLINGVRGKIERDESGKHTIMEIDDEVYVMAVSEKEKNEWRRISKVSRHPVNGQLMKVTTRSGRTTRATLSHSFLKRTTEGIIPIEGSKLKVGDRVPVVNSMPTAVDKITQIEIGNKKVDLNEEFGYFCGSIVSGGTYSKTGLKINKKHNTENIYERIVEKYGWQINISANTVLIKNAKLMDFLANNFKSRTGFAAQETGVVPEWIYQANIEFIRGFLSAIVDYDGIIDCKKMVLKFYSKNRDLLVDVSLLFAFMGVYCVFGEERRLNTVINTITISRKYAPKLERNLNLVVIDKRLGITDIVNYVNRDEVHDVAEYIDKIPCCGTVVADVAKMLKMPQHSRIYGRWRSKESIGRRTLEKYLNAFKVQAGTNPEPDVKKYLMLLEQACYSDVVWDEVMKIDVYDGEDDEYVYDFTVPECESFMVDDGILVHNTLNSVEWNTEIIIKEDGKLVTTKIGEWINGRIDVAKEEDLEYHPHNTVLEYVKDKKILVPACTEDGKIIWDEVEAVTRHPVINKDGSKTLLKITTAGGRTVTATKAKSFLKRVNNKIIGVDGDSIKVGDYLPVNCYDKENYEVIPDVMLSTGLVDLKRGWVLDYEGEDGEVIRRLMEEDIVYDKIVKIEEVESEHPWVYDLTVKETRNFNISNGLCMRDTFHNAGVGASAVVTSTGVPRIKEIINVSKTIKTPAMEIYLKTPHTEDVNKAKIISNEIEFTKLYDIVDKTMIIYENPDKPTEHAEDLEFVQLYQEFSEIMGVSTCPDDDLSKWVLRIVFNKEKMMNKNIYLADIQDVIQRNNVEDDMECSFSDDNAKELMMRIKVREDSYDGDYLAFLQEMEKILMAITIRGIPNVEKAIPQMMKRLSYREDGSYNQTTEWYLATVGVNLLDVLMNENVDAERTLSNDINEINEIFGIEATRNIIMRELLKMPDYNVNYRHISLLGDIMTHRGVIMKIERHGINRSTERGPIAKATFEESTEILVKASTFGEKDKMGGVSSNIMFGQLPKVGTNAFELLFDEGKFINELKDKKNETINRRDVGELVDDLEQKLGEEYKENVGEMIEDAFDFSFDLTKNPQKQLLPHIFPEESIMKKSAPTKRKIMMKKA